MRLMAILLLLSLCSQPLPALACNKPINISYGPYISIAMVKKFLGNVHDRLEADSGCILKYHLFGSFEELVASMIGQEHVMVGVPGSFNEPMAELGYEVVASLQTKEKYNYLVVNQDSGIQKAEHLVGKDLLIMSPFSETGAGILQVLQDKKLLTQVHVKIKNNYEAMLMAVARRKADAAMVPSIYWRWLDKRLRDSQLMVIEKVPSNQMAFLILPGNPDLKKLMLKVLKQDTALNWTDPVAADYPLPVIEAFLKRYVNNMLREGNQP